MRHITGRSVVLPIVTSAVVVSGCASRGAPSFILFGAFFPAWMLVAGIGILAAIGVRAIMIATGLVEVVPLQLLVCTSAGLTAAIIIWTLWFGV